MIACLFYFLLGAFQLMVADRITVLSKHNASLWKRTKCGFNGTDIITRWGQQINPSNSSTLLPEYPRPQLKRDINNSWVNLNGLWEFEIATNNNSILTPPFNKTLNNIILVPFPVESCLSGIGKNYQYLWYRFVFNINKSWFNINNKTERIILNFGAVDWSTNIFINGKYITKNEGGYNSFSIDLTIYLTQNYNEILLFVYDPSNLGNQPNGKQNIGKISNPGGDQFTPSSNLTFDHCLSSGEKNISSQYISIPYLNDKPIYFAGWLDQSFYPDGLYSPPNNNILYFDVNAALEFGFNTIRVHEKVQPELYYYYADLLGVLIWQDMPQKYGHATDDTIPYFINDLKQMIQQKISHPSIIHGKYLMKMD
eukprot:103764_1